MSASGSSREVVDGRARLLYRALSLLFRASPIACAGAVLTALLQGIAPNVITLAGARLIGLAPALARSSGARTAAIVALSTLAAALVVERTAATLAPVTFSYLSFRFSAALDRLRITGCCDLPGLEHFESPVLADRIESAGWSKSAPATVVSRSITLLRRITMLLGSLLIAARLGWWVVPAVSVGAVAVAVNDWRHAGRHASLQRRETGRLRFAAYHRELAADPRYAREIRLFSLGRWLAERQQRFWSEAMAPVFADMRRQLRENGVINGVRVAALLVPLVVAMARLRGGSLSTEDFTAVLLALRTASNGLFTLEGAPGQLRLATAFLPEVFTIADLPRRDPRLRAGGRPGPPPALQRGIRFEGVVFAYPGTARTILEGVDLLIPAGTSVALVGENGAGKSTLVKLMCRFYEPTDGRITLDGVDIREFDLSELRQRIAVIFQEFTRWPMSAADNVAVGWAGFGGPPDGHRTDRASGRPVAPPLEHAAALAGAGPFIDALPDGWDTVLSREFGGVDLSGGQWQRLALARLLVAREARATPVLILDEPTAALDVEVEAHLYRRFEELTRGATTLLISHRLSTVRMATCVAVLAEGRIVELGRHDDLIASGGRYAELFHLQARRFVERRADA